MEPSGSQLKLGLDRDFWSHIEQQKKGSISDWREQMGCSKDAVAESPSMETLYLIDYDKGWKKEVNEAIAPPVELLKLGHTGLTQDM